MPFSITVNSTLSVEAIPQLTRVNIRANASLSRCAITIIIIAFQRSYHFASNSRACLSWALGAALTAGGSQYHMSSLERMSQERDSFGLAVSQKMFGSRSESRAAARKRSADP